MKFPGSSLPAGVRRLFRLHRVDDAPDIAEELRFHIDATRDELIAAGMSADDAHAAAIARFGNVADISNTLLNLTQERERIVQRTEWLDAFKQDVKFGVRQLRKTPAFTVIALLTLALGIGANTAIFSIVYSVLLRPLPYANSERLLDIAQANEGDAPFRFVTYGSFGVWEQQSQSFDALGGYHIQSATLTGVGDPIRVRGLRASHGFWGAQYIKPELGRYYDQASDVDGASPVVVLSYPLWATTFGRDASIVGRTIMLDGKSHAVVAVAAPEYSLTPGSAQYWTPLKLDARERSSFGDHELTVVGLLRKNVRVEQAQAELARIESTLAKQYPDAGIVGSVVTRPLVDAVVGSARQQYMLLLGAVGLVLLIACGNVANLMLARATSRRAEMAVRRALGASGGRIVAQLMIEGGLLAFGGALLGVGIGAVGIRLLVSATPPGVPRIQDASLNVYVLAFSATLAVGSSIIFALLPALRSAGFNLQDALRDGGRETRGRAKDSVRRVLIISEIALALVLLTGAGLLIRSARELQRVSIGLNATNVFIGRIGLPDARYATPAAIAGAYAQIVDRVRTIPGVTNASLIARVPIDRRGADCEVFREDARSDSRERYNASFRSTMPGYFATMQVPLLAGRDLLPTDRADSPLVVVINSALAKQLFGTVNPIGKRIAQCIGAGDGRGGAAFREIVGVVGDVRADGRVQPMPFQVFYPTTQFVEPLMTLVVRSEQPVAALTTSIRRELAAFDPMLAISNTRTMDDVLDGDVASSRFTTLLLVLLGATGLVLATVGIYGVIAYFVSQRTHEMGIRMALGASNTQVKQLVVRQGLVLALAGVAIGELVAFLASKSLSGLVYGVSVRDPLTFVMVGVLLTIVALIASFIPARRATRVDPLKALRT